MVAICGNMTINTAKADWSHPDYLEPDLSSTTSSEEISAGSGEEAQANGIVANGFSPEADGFSFENYGNEYGSDGLTPVEMQRIYGERVCAYKEGGECILTPPAEQWMDQENKGSDGGHCSGMAALSTLMYYNKVSPQKFGADTASELSIADNKPLQHEIAFWAATRATEPIGYKDMNESASIKYSSKYLEDSPNAVLDNLTKYLMEGKHASEWWTLGMSNLNKGGHAVTPFGVEDMGDGLFKILVYDNNYPKDTKAIEVDRNANTWKYEASINPEETTSEWTGDGNSHNLDLQAISPRLGIQECEFCDETQNATNLSAKTDNESALNAEDQDNSVLTVKDATAPRHVQIWLDGNASLLITDTMGRRIGRVEANKFVNEIPGAEIQPQYDGGAKPLEKWREPVYDIPTGLNFTIKVDGTWLKSADSQDVTMIGPGYDLAVEGMWLDPGEQDYIDVATVRNDIYRLTYRTDYNETPDIIMGKESEPADYEFVLRGAQMQPGGKLNAELDMKKSRFTLNTIGNNESGKYELLIHRIDDNGEQFFGNKDVGLRPNDSAYLDFLDWKGIGKSMYLKIDHGSKGTIDETVELKSQQDLYTYWETNSTAKKV